jgi:putative ABC transport system permease protein
MTSIPGPGIIPGRRVLFTYEDYLHLKRQAYWLRRLSPELARGDLVTASRQNRGNFDVHGVLTDYVEIRSLEVEAGRILDPADMQNAARVCLIGAEAADQLFKGTPALGAEIEIQGLPYRIVGLLKRKDQNSNYSGPDNTKIFVPYTAMRRDFPLPHSDLGDREIDNFIAQPVSLEMNDAAEFQVRRILGELKHFDPLDQDALPIWNTVTGSKMMDRMFGSMKIFLGFVAVVTLMLGGIGVMNIMLVSVRARTREIGLRKAVGATRHSIQTMFFFEALLISLGSGLMGYGGAMGLCWLLNQLPPLDFFAGFLVEPWVGAAAFGFLLFVALAAAYYPAYTAAELDPVDALRFEE